MNFLSVLDLSEKDIVRIFALADSLKHQREFSLGSRKVLVLLFEKASTRTRVSFEAAIAQLNGSSIYIDSRTSQLSRGESIADTAMVLSMYADFIAARLYRQSDLEELAMHSSVPVINALTELEHPCQALSDLYTIKEVFGKVKGLRIAFVGDIAANTANSLMVVATMLGARLVLVGPSSCRPNMKYVNAARKHGEVAISNDMKSGLSGVDVIYTDTFVSMGEEREAARRRKLFGKYIVDSKAVSYAKKNCRVMHCLPAHRGEEVSADAIDGSRSIVWEQARNKLAVEKALLVWLSRDK